MKLLALLTRLNEGILDAMMDTAANTAISRLVEEMLVEFDGMARAEFNLETYDDPYPNESELPDDTDAAFAQWLPTYAENHVYHAAYNITSKMQYDANGIVVHRVIKADENFPAQIASQGIGEYWSWDEHAAEAHWGGKGNIEYHIVGRVDPKHVDWEHTLTQNAHPSFTEEREIYIPQGAPIEVIEVRANGKPIDPSQYGGQQMLAASIGESGIASSARFARLTKLREAAGGQFDTSTVWYHGTRGDWNVKDFDPSKDRNTSTDSNAIFLTPDPNFAVHSANSNWHWKDHQQEENVMPLFVRDDLHIFNHTDPEHLDMLRHALSSIMGGAPFDERMDIPLGGDNPKGLSRLSMSIDRFVDDIAQGNWASLESELVQKAIKGMEFDGFTVEEHGRANLGIFDPSNVRSVFDLSEGILRESDDGRLARAQAMGFDTSTVFYHGTNSDIEEFSRGERGGRAGNGIYFAMKHFVPNTAAKHRTMSKGGNATVYPVYLKAENQYVTDTHGDDLIIGLNAEALEARGYTGVDVLNLDGELIDRTIFDPSNIRSVNAQFNDANSNNILASIGESVGLEEGPDSGHDMNLSKDDIQKHLIHFLMKAKEAGLGEPTIVDTIGHYDVLSFSRSMHGDGQILFVMDIARPILYVAIESYQGEHNIHGVAIVDVRSTGEYPAAKFYYWILENINNILYSDDQQTIQAGRLWANLDRYYPDVEVTDEGDRFRAYHDAFYNESITESAGGQFVYHATMAKNLGKIMQKGLTFFNPSLWVKAGDGERYQDEPSVFAFEHPVDAWRWAAKMEWEFKEPAVVITLKRGNSWGQDPSDDISLQMGKGKALQSLETIPASDIVGAKTVAQIGTPVSTGLHGAEYEQHVEKVLTEDVNSLPPKLYHGTTVANVMEMLQDNVLNAGIHHGKSNEPDGPRLTKSYKVAQSFPPYSSYPKAVLEFSTARLASSYELVEYNDGVHSVDEQEVVVLAKSIEPLDKYVSAIHITRDAMAGMRHHGDEEVEQMIGNLWSHPLVKIS
jgi:hypothetical protein